jgi:hypothetical protein
MKLLVFFIGIFNLLLAFQSNLCHHLDWKKYPKSIFKNYVIFQGLGMILVMKTNFINQNIY